MKYRIKKIDGHGFFPDKDLDELFNVEASDDGERWFTVSTHLSAEGAEKKLHVIDPTGIELRPGQPDECQGTGKEDPELFCCGDCDYFLKCFPEWKDPEKALEALEDLQEG